jgi:chorismate synthase
VAAAAIAKRVLKDYCGVEVLGYVKKVGPLQLQVDLQLQLQLNYVQVERL